MCLSWQYGPKTERMRMTTEVAAPRAAEVVARGSWPARLMRRLVVTLLILSGMLTFSYTGAALSRATKLVYATPHAATRTPASLGLDYREVTFPARVDGVTLRGWLIPGVLTDGRLTLDRTLIVVHGHRENRADADFGLLDFSAALAHAGFAVLAYDTRGAGASDPAPDSLGSFERRDVLGAVDFLRSRPLPYPALGRPRVIAGWGVSMGAATLLLAAAEEPAITAVVADTAFADVLPLLERELPKQGAPAPLVPGVLLAGWALYGVSYYDVRPVDAVARIAPRPIFFIHGDGDDFIPATNLDALVRAARAAPGAQVQSWLVPGVRHHAQTYHTAGQEYVRRVVAFFDGTLGPDVRGT
jgi:fermentation-respiration switch protein FrsA (DUF1100 family)